jgi:MarR family transcriptional regulator, organic hydroperoxide resistance regulator
MCSFDEIIFNTSIFDQSLSDRIRCVKPTMPKFSPPSAIDLLLDNQLCFALYAASLAMTKTYRPLLAPLGLTYPQYVVMLALWQHGELTAGALAQAVALDAGTLVPLVRKLVAQGLLDRRRSDVDERVVLITLTPAGRALKRRAQAVHDQIACSTQCSPTELTALTAALQALRSALSAETDNR